MTNAEHRRTTTSCEAGRATGATLARRFQSRTRQALWLLVALTCVSPAALAAPSTPSVAAVSGKPDPLVDMFVWWNDAYKRKDGFTAESFGKHFTSDAVMRINGRDRCKGLADLAKHFREIQSKTEMVVIDLPFIDEFSSANGDRIFTHHFVRAREHGKDSRERVMGYAVIRDGKISLINFVSIPDPGADAPPATATQH